MKLENCTTIGSVFLFLITFGLSFALLITQKISKLLEKQGNQHPPQKNKIKLIIINVYAILTFLSFFSHNQANYLTYSCKENAFFFFKYLTTMCLWRKFFKKENLLIIRKAQTKV